MKFTGLLKAAAAVVLLSAVSAANAAPITIDDFSEPNPRRFWSLTNLDPDPFLFSDAGPGILGGERDVMIDLRTTDDGNPQVTGTVGTQLTGRSIFQHSTGAGYAGTATLQYDGFDSGSLANARLLGQPQAGPPPGPGIDLTDNGSNNAFLFDFLLADGGEVEMVTQFIIRLTSLDGGTASLVSLIPDINPANPLTVPFFFASFTTSGANFSFTEVDSIEILINDRALTSVELILDNIRAGEFVIQEIPEPASIITMAIGCLGFALMGYRRRQTSSAAA